MMLRRTFLSAIAILPGLKWLKPTPAEASDEVDRDHKTCESVRALSLDRALQRVEELEFELGAIRNFHAIGCPNEAWELGWLAILAVRRGVVSLLPVPHWELSDHRNRQSLSDSLKAHGVLHITHTELYEIADEAKAFTTTQDIHRYMLENANKNPRQDRSWRKRVHAIGLRYRAYRRYWELLPSWRANA
jgi:hypothetical protein